MLLQGGALVNLPAYGGKSNAETWAMLLQNEFTRAMVFEGVGDAIGIGLALLHLAVARFQLVGMMIPPVLGLFGVYVAVRLFGDLGIEIGFKAANAYTLVTGVKYLAARGKV